MPVDVTLHVGIGFPNLLDNVETGSPSYVYSPGAPWDPDFPLDNILSRNFEDEARSTGLSTGHTQFVIDHGGAVTARALVLVGNFSEDAQLSWQRGSTPTGGAVGSIALRDAWQFSPLVYDGRDHHVILVLPAAVAARYDYVQISDTTNPDGVLKLYRAGLFPLFVPSYNASYGLRHGFRSLSGADRSPGGGSLYAYKQRVLRTEQFLLEWLSNSEGDTVHELQRVADLTEEVLYVPHVSDPAAQQRYGMLGVLEELSGAELPRVNTRSVGFKVVQVA